MCFSLIYQFNYSSGKGAVAILIVIIALADELLASPTLLATSLSEIPKPPTEALVSAMSNKTTPANITTKATGQLSFSFLLSKLIRRLNNLG